MASFSYLTFGKSSKTKCPPYSKLRNQPDIFFHVFFTHLKKSTIMRIQHFFKFLLLLFLWGGSINSIFAQSDLNVSNSIILTSDTTFENVIIENGAVFTMNGHLTVTQNLIVRNGGVLTHSIGFYSGVQIDCQGTVVIEVGGQINVNSKGLRGGFNGITDTYGETYNEIGNIVSGAGPGINTENPGWGGAGGTYGGQGGRGRPDIGLGTTYGSIDNPNQLGSGGGGSPCGGCNRHGGNGGGAVRIISRNLVVDGSISAHGAAADPESNIGGGGSGGSVYIQADTIRGTGTISANGGEGRSSFYPSGGGGGGRIALHYDETEMAIEQLESYGGQVYYPGAAGTIYLKQYEETTGRLVIKNNDIKSEQSAVLQLTDLNFKAIEIQQEGRVIIQSALPYTTLLVMDSVKLSKGLLQLESGVELSISGSATETALSVKNNATLRFLNGSQLTTSGGVIVDNSELTTFTNLGFTQNQVFQLRGTSTLNIHSGSVLSVPYFNTENFRTGQVWIEHGARLDILDDIAEISIHLTKDGSFGPDDQLASLTVLAGGEMTHSSHLLSGLTINADQLTIEDGGRINTNEKGLSGGFVGSTGAYGEAFDGSGNIVPGAGSGINTENPGWGGAGGTYGGQGGRGRSDIELGQAYGSIDHPQQLGAGGGGSPCGGCNRPGGTGGGLIHIITTDLIINGAITANGQSISNNTEIGGGGSGGSIYINANSISGSGILQARGGEGTIINFYKSGAGGGGRIALHYENLALPLSRISTKGGEQFYPGAAGTIYLKNQQQSKGKLLIDNEGQESEVGTPFIGPTALIDSVFIKNTAMFLPTEAALPDTWTVALASGSIYHSDTLLVPGNTTIIGSGAIFSHLNNTGIISPGTPTSAGHLTVHGSLQQQAGGRIKMGLGGFEELVNYSKLTVDSSLVLADTLDIEFLNNFSPQLGNRFDILKAGTIIDTFAEVNNWDGFGVVYERNNVTLVRDYNYLTNSTTDSVLILSPSGHLSFTVTLRDEAGTPVIGSRNAWLEFSDYPDLVACSSERTWPQVFSLAASDTLGKLHFFPAAGGCADGEIRVMSSHGLLAAVPLRSLDQDGGLIVTAHDFTGAPCNDYNSDNTVDEVDWDFFTTHLQQSCIEDLNEYLSLELYTDPPYGSIFGGDTIQVCALVHNSLNEMIQLDSIAFGTSFFGIANTFGIFATQYGQLLPAASTTTICADYIVPDGGHGCFQASLFPSLNIEDCETFNLGDSLVYGREITEGNHKLKIGTNAGYELVSVQYDPITFREDWNSLTLWGDQLGSSLGAVELMCLIETEVAREAALLWNTDLPQFQGVPEEDSILFKLSLIFDYQRAFLRSNSSDEDGLVNDISCSTNGCGTESGFFANVPIPDFDFTECCNQHDYCYCNPDCEQSVLGCNNDLGLCILYTSNLPFRLRWRLAYIYWTTLNFVGAFAFNFDHCNPPPKSRQINIDVQERTTTGSNLSTSSHRGPGNDPPLLFTTFLSSDSTTFRIPVGNNFGGPLELVTQAFMPENWDYTITPSSSVDALDTIQVTIFHDSFVACKDTGRVVVYAYNTAGEYAGYAEVIVFDNSLKGDVNNNGIVDGEDFDELQAFLLQQTPLPEEPESADLTGDSFINIADLTRFAGYFYSSQVPFQCNPLPLDTLPVVLVNSIYDSDTTLLTILTPEALTGIQLSLTGEESITGGDYVGAESLEIYFHQIADTAIVQVFDPLAINHIRSTDSLILKLPGEWSILGGVAADSLYRNLSVQGIVQPPLAPTITIIGTNSICLGDSLTLEASAGYDAYYWSNGATTQSIVIDDDSPYTVIGESNTGLSSPSDTVRIITYAIPELPLIIGLDTLLVCPGDSLLVMAQDTFLAYAWSTGETEAEIWLNLPDEYTITVTNSNGCINSQDIALLNYSIDVPSISAETNTLIASPAVSYQWYYNNELIAGAIEETFLATVSGDYSVATIDQNGCSAISESYSLIVNKLNALQVSEFQLFPNPSDGLLTLRFSLEPVHRTQELTLQLIDISGKHLFEESVQVLDTTIDKQLDFRQFGNGVYFLVIRSGESEMINKIILSSQE
jgi:hypothetical protein